MAAIPHSTDCLYDPFKKDSCRDSSRDATKILQESDGVWVSIGNANLLAASKETWEARGGKRRKEVEEGGKRG